MSQTWQQAVQLWVDLGAFLRTNALNNHLFRTTEIIQTTQGIEGSKIWAHGEGGWSCLGSDVQASPELTELLDAARRSGRSESRDTDGFVVVAAPIGKDMVLQAKTASLDPADIAQFEHLAAEIAEVKGLFDAGFRTHRDRRDLETRLRDQARELRRLLRKRQAPIGQDASMQQLISSASRIGTSTLPVLITGETGTGKEVLARFVHQMSKRPKPMVVVDCGAIPESLLESELFGAERGAFTGATSRVGRFEEADGGTLLLDEIGELPLSLQPKLLRVLQDSRIRRVGGNKEIELDLRIIAATHRDLRDMVAAGTFREDLYFRLRVVELSVPPLRARGDDVILLANHFIRQYCAEVEREFLVLSEEAQAKLVDHDWPGNVRELKNTLRSAILTARGPEITIDDIQLEESRIRRSLSARRTRGSTGPSVSKRSSSASRSGNGNRRRSSSAPPQTDSPVATAPALAPRPPIADASPRRLSVDLADWFWTNWSGSADELGSPWEALEGHILRAALAKAGGSLADAGDLCELSADSFGRHLQKLGGNLAARAIDEHPLGAAIRGQLGSPGLLDRIRALLLTELLVFCRGNKSEMARVLGWGRGTLSRELVRLSVVSNETDEKSTSIS